MPTPEQLARKEIDCQLEAAGWQVQNYKSMNIHAAVGVMGKFKFRRLKRKIYPSILNPSQKSK